jgi:hypothetical protein
MNIGIVLGVSEYQNTSNLPGCLNDASSFKQLLELSNKCEDILYLTENTESSNIKSKIASFVSKYQTNDIDEVIFYFTGHGLFEDDEFYYVLSDYSSSKKKQTSLENSELDNLLRSLSAKLTVKIVDACQSGTRYVKDPDTFQKYLNKSEQSYDKCYFFYSSQNDQSSYQNSFISDFTASFLNTFISRPNQDVRYKDIMDTLTDSFSSNPKQTPFFVMQGNYTEHFGQISNDAVVVLQKAITSAASTTGKPTDSHKSLLQLVQEQADLYCTESEAFQSVDNVSQTINTLSLPADVEALYELDVKIQSDSSIPVSTNYIGKYLSDCEIDYLVSIDKQTKTRTVRKGGFFPASFMLRGEDVPTVEEEYEVAVGAESTTSLPYDHIFIRSSAKYPTVNDSGCIIIPYVSQTKIVIFSVNFLYRTREWDVKEINKSTCEWTYFDEYIKEDEKIKKKIISLFENYVNFTINPLKEKFGLLEVADEEAEDS